MIGLVSFSQVNCAETNGGPSCGIETMRRSPSPTAINHDSASVVLAGSEPATNDPTDFDVQTLITNDDVSVSSVSSSNGETEIDFYGMGMTTGLEESPRIIYEAILNHMSNHLPMLTDIFIEDDEGLEAGEHDEEEEEEENSGTENNSDYIRSSSYDGSNIKTRGGSKESVRTPAVVHGEHDDDANIITEVLVGAEIDNCTGSLLCSSFSANSMADLLQQESEQASPTINNFRLRSTSPYTRSSRAGSIELDDLAMAARTAASSLVNINGAHQTGAAEQIDSENLIEEELMKQITPEAILILNLIDFYASEDLRGLCDNVGTFILGHLAQQATKMPTRPSPTLAGKLLEQLCRVFSLVTSHVSPDDHLEYGQIILMSLEVTISDDLVEYDSFGVVRDALILLMMDFPDIFSDEFLRKQAVYEILQKIVIRSSALKRFDTIDHIRLLSNLSNIFDLQHYFNVRIDIHERKSSDDEYLTLKEVNLPSVSEDEDGSAHSIDKKAKKPMKKSLRKKTKKDHTASGTANTKLVKRNNDRSKLIKERLLGVLRVIYRFAWLNRVVIFQAAFVAFILQIFIFRK